MKQLDILIDLIYLNKNIITTYTFDMAHGMAWQAAVSHLQIMCE